MLFVSERMNGIIMISDWNNNINLFIVIISYRRIDLVQGRSQSLARK